MKPRHRSDGCGVSVRQDGGAPLAAARRICASCDESVRYGTEIHERLAMLAKAVTSIVIRSCTVPDDLFPPTIEMLEAVYFELDRLLVSYAFFGFAATLSVVASALAVALTLIGR
jgi:hypothetical protein